MADNALGQPVGESLAWSPRAFPPTASIEGRCCRLEPLEADHAGPLFNAFAAAENDGDWTYLPDEKPIDPAANARLIEERSRSRDPQFFAIVPRGGAPSGTIAFMRIDPAHGVIEIGHVNFAPRLQRTAAATEAIALLMRRAFDDLGYRRLEWKCDSLNARSRRAALRLGLAFEGIFRQAIVTKGRNRDTAWYAMIDRDWPAARDALDLWLRPENFDQAGRQRQTLGTLAGRTAVGERRTGAGL